MRFRLHSDGPGPPCKHMESFLNRAADGTAGKFARWYALAHAIRCQRCMKYLDALQAMVARLRQERDKEIPRDVLQRLTGAVSLATARARQGPSEV